MKHVASLLLRLKVDCPFQNTQLHDIFFVRRLNSSCLQMMELLLKMGGTSVTLCLVTLVILVYFRGKRVMLE